MIRISSARWARRERRTARRLTLCTSAAALKLEQPGGVDQRLGRLASMKRFQRPILSITRWARGCARGLQQHRQDLAASGVRLSAWMAIMP